MEVFANVGKYLKEGFLGIYRPPGGSEMVLIEELPDEKSFRLFPARVGAFGLLGSMGRRDGGSGVGVQWYAGNLEGSRSARGSRRDERSSLHVWEWYPVVFDGA